MRKVVVTTSSFGEYDRAPLELLKSNFSEVVLNPYGRKLERSELIDLAKDADVIIAGTELYTDAIFDHLNNLKILSRCGAGIDNVDLESAKKRNIIIYNTPDAPTIPVAELTIGLIVDCLRKISNSNNNMKNNIWNKQMGNLLYKKRVGIIGYGRIGKKVANILEAFEAEIVYSDLNKDESSRHQLLDLDELLKTSDIVTLHCNSSINDFLIGKNNIHLIKKGAVIINTARGDLIDEDELYKMLNNGNLSAAGLDVFYEEPYIGKLRTLHNVTLTPHIGSYALEGRVIMEMQAVVNLLKGLCSNHTN